MLTLLPKYINLSDHSRFVIGLFTTGRTLALSAAACGAFASVGVAASVGVFVRAHGRQALSKW